MIKRAQGKLKSLGGRSALKKVKALLSEAEWLEVEGGG